MLTLLLEEICELELALALMVFWTDSFLNGWKESVYIWSETVWASFFGQETNWVQMRFGGKEIPRLCLKLFETLGILAEFHNVFLLEFSVSLLAIFFMGFGPGFFSGKWCSIYRQDFVDFFKR